MKAKQKVLNLLITVFLIVFGGGMFSCFPGTSIAGDTCKIAFMDPLSGPVALVGEQVGYDYKFFVEQQNRRGGILGKKIEPIYVDTEFKPQVAVRKAEKLVLDDNIDFIVIGSSSNIGIALAPVATKHKKILVNVGALSDDIQGKYFSRYAFRPTVNTWGQGAAYGSYYAKRTISKLYLLNPDYAFGHDFAKAVRAVLTQKNPKITIAADEYFPVGIKDWAPYLSKVKASGAEVIVSAVFGTDTLTLLKQINQFGLKVELGSYTAPRPSILEAAGDAAVGVVAAFGVVNTDEAPGVVKTQDLYHEMYKNHPDKDARYNYGASMDRVNGLNFFAAAVEKAGSFDPGKIIGTWEGMRYTSLNGQEVYMRACDHQLITSMSVAKVVKGRNRFLGEIPYLGKPVATVPREDAAIPLSSDYNPRCK